MIAGNHELGFDPKNKMSQVINNRSGHIGDSPQCGNVDVKNLRETSTEPGLIREEALNTGESTEYNIRKELTNCTYLEDSAVQLCGLKIYGELNIDTLSPESRVLVFDVHVSSCKLWL